MQAGEKKGWEPVAGGMATDSWGVEGSGKGGERGEVGVGMSGAQTGWSSTNLTLGVARGGEDGGGDR